MRYLKEFSLFESAVKPPRDFTETAWKEAKEIAAADVAEIKKLVDKLLPEFRRRVPEAEWSAHEAGYSYSDAYFGWVIEFKPKKERDGWKSGFSRFLAIYTWYKTKEYARGSNDTKYCTTDRPAAPFTAEVHYYVEGNVNPTDRITKTSLFKKADIIKLVGNMEEDLKKAKFFTPW